MKPKYGKRVPVYIKRRICILVSYSATLFTGAVVVLTRYGFIDFQIGVVALVVLLLVWLFTAHKSGVSK